MTAGWEALHEAMRIEQARIYSQLQHEHRSPQVRPQVAQQTERPATLHDLEAARLRKGVA